MEGAPAENAPLDRAVAAAGVTLAIYANNGGDELALSVMKHAAANTRLQFVLVYTVSQEAKDAAVQAVTEAVADGALSGGEEAGLPVLRFALEDTGDAHDAVEAGVVGKVLIDLT